MVEKGLIQIYTGDGKGKTTAAFGLALRTAGQGKKVLIYQFLKPAELDTGERKAVKGIDNITVESFDGEWDMCEPVRNENVLAKTRPVIATALERIAELAEKKAYDCIILDEIVFCLSKNLAKLGDIRKIIERKNPAVELVLTGAGAGRELIEMADLVTEMKKIKHPFDKGVNARKGIEY
ncbi:MAG: cob(I)yrinic acid a,c-diamide adenosyltransferase [Planctomycetota bacterium]|jgi:cob(I)alamin adenosyltransferase